MHAPAKYNDTNYLKRDLNWYFKNILKLKFKTAFLTFGGLYLTISPCGKNYDNI